jgi:hypothetical protein
MALDFNSEPYFDDYEAAKDFYRILFRPSYAVQARELTQLQTILQNQVSRFGDHVFKNGSQVIPGSVNIDNKVHFVKLEQFTGTLDVTTYIETLKNKVVTGETSGVKMVVLDTSAQTDAVVDNLDQPTLYCKVVGTADDTITNRLTPGENLIAYSEDNQIDKNFRLTEDQLSDIQVIVKATGSAGEEASAYLTEPTKDFPNPESSNVLGYAYSVDVKAGIYYVDGTFVRNDDLKLYVGRFTNTPSYRVGFKVTEEYVTPEDDGSILDNATGSYNFAAPGAHRYKISLSLVKLPLVATDAIRFVELVRVVEGRIQYKIERSSYAELEKTLARRTYDESGNYEVNKFKLTVREHLNDGTNQGVYPELIGNPVAGVTYGDKDKVVLVVDPGKAYIQGYEVESTASQFLEIPKAREINNVENGHVKRLGLQNISLNYGNYVKVNSVYKFPDVSNFESVYLVKKQQIRQAILTPTVNQSTGAITSIAVTDPGEGYTPNLTNQTVTIVASTSNHTAGTNDAVATYSTDASGRVSSVSVTTQGLGYQNVNPLCLAISTSGAAPVKADIVGTAKVKAIELHSGDYASSKSIYKLGLFDIVMNSGYAFESDVKSIVGMNSASNFSCNITQTLLPLDGWASSTVNSTTQIVAASSAFVGKVVAGDIVYLNETKVGTVTSVVDNFTLNISTAEATVANGRIAIGRSIIYEPSYEPMLFPIGQYYVKTLKGRNETDTADTVSNTSLKVRRLFSPRASQGNGSGNKVEFNVTDANETIELDTDLSNYMLIHTDTNTPINITTTNTDFNTSGARQTVIFSGVPAGTYKLIATVTQEEVNAVAKLKKLYTNATQVITNKNIIAGTSITLQNGDILRLKSVLMTPGVYTFDANNSIDITSRYTLDNGQRDTYYTNGKILLKPGFQAPNGAIQIKYDYFGVDENSNGNYFSVDSYKGVVDYSEIPSYFISDKATGKRSEIRLTDVLDFRPYLISSNANGTFHPEMPKYGSDVLTPTAFYLGRIDKIVLDSVGKFNILSGVPNYEPKEQIDPKDGMVIASVIVPPYTHSSKEVVIKQRDNKRYTMRDIGKLERRISNLEYYVTLSLLEKSTADMTIQDTQGNDCFKNGFIVDQFSGHSIGDVKNEDYRVSMDTQNRVLRPMYFSQSLEVVEDIVSGTDRSTKAYQKTGDLITLPYTSSPFIFNNHATRSMDIQAMSSGAFKGQVTLVPEGDTWKAARNPDLVKVDDNNYDAIKFIVENVIGTQWDEWQTHWTSSTPVASFTNETRQYLGGPSTHNLVTGYQTTIYDETGYQTRNGLSTSVSQGDANMQDYGDRVVDVSYVPFMRARPVTVVAQNLKPTTKFFPFFDNVAVGAYFKPADKFTVTREGQSLMSFNWSDLNDNVLVDTDRRSHNGKVEQAFAIGDVLTNVTHGGASITQINNLTTAARSFDLYVDSSVGIRVGHHVVLYNLDYSKANGDVILDDLKENQEKSNGDKVFPETNGLLSNSASAKQLNLRKFKVKAVSNTKLTLTNIDETTDIEPFDSYNLTSYDTNKFGKLYRLKASAVVAYGGVISASDAIGPITQDLFLVNVKNGFSIGESLYGSVTIGKTSSTNGVTVNAINGVTGETNTPVMNDLESPVITDSNGTAVGVFYIPETDALSFRTGERSFKFTDNPTNSDASFDSSGVAVYYSQGISVTKERTFVSTRPVEFVQTPTYEDSRQLGLPAVRRTTTSTKQIYQYVQDPLAQTFTVSAEGGAFVTSLDLYFDVKGTRPVSVEIRNTDNGVPSTKIVPFSKVTLPAEQLNTSSDSSVATRFTFKSPVYLQDSETYAFVILTDEPGTRVYVSEMNQTDMLTGNIISGQPLTGSLYASQNAKEWEIYQLLDVKFSLNKAKFDITQNAELLLKTNATQPMTLPENPFEITPGTNKIRVYAPNHGLLAGDKFTITNVAEGYYGTEFSDAGIPHTALNGVHTVLANTVDRDTFMFNLTTDEAGQNILTYKSGSTIIPGSTSNFVKGEYGGSGVRCTTGINVDTLYLKTSDLNFQETSLTYSVVAQKTTGTFTGDLPLVQNNNFNFPSRVNLRSYENQSVDINGSKVSSLQIKAALSSSNSNVSPAVDLQQLAVYGISNLIDNFTADINDSVVDKRHLIGHGDVVSADYFKIGTGTISISNNSATLNGYSSSTLFTTEVGVGDKIYKSDGTTLIGTVSSITSNYVITLSSNYTGTALTNVAYQIASTPSIVFENDTVTGLGVIRSNIDRADNRLASAGIGKTLVIYGVQPVSNGLGKDGTYVVTNVITSSDTNTFAGNSDLDKTVIYLDRAFSDTNQVTIDMTQDSDFDIYVYDKYVSDIAPIGATNASNYVTRTLALTEAATGFKVIFDGNIVNNTDVKVYYRTWTGNADLRLLPYKDSGFVATNSDIEGKYIERSFDVGLDPNNQLDPFYNIQIKVVFKSSDPVYVPKIKNLRLVALS